MIFLALRDRPFALCVLVAYLFCLPLAPLIHAQERPAKPLQNDPFRDFEPPTAPSAPPPLARKAVPRVFTCQRKFQYDGKEYLMDSHLGQDAENLRPFLADVSEALGELNTYQRNRKKVSKLGYVGTLGLLTLAGSYILSRSYEGSKSRRIRNIGVIVGASTATISLAVGMSILRENEEHLQRGVQLFNKKNPETPIELQFRAQF